MVSARPLFLLALIFLTLFSLKLFCPGSMSAFLLCNRLFLSAAVFSREAERPFDRAQDAPSFVFGIGKPIFFGGRQGVPQKVRESGKSAAAHVDTEHCATDETHRLVVDVRDAFGDLPGHPDGARVGLCVNLD